MIKTIIKKPIKKAITKNLTAFRTTVLTRHPSHAVLRSELPLLPFRSIIRLGSETIPKDGKTRIELNSPQSIKNSANKLLMKKCFTRVGCQTAGWWTTIDGINFYTPDLEGMLLRRDLSYPIIAKSLYGSRGRGNTKLDTQQALQSWIQGKTLSHYIFEKFVPYSREYRLHITNKGCFYTCRKLIKNDAPEGTWQRHDDVCTWVLETNPAFKKPNNWNLIVQDCIKAKNALGLDICAFDVMVQGPKKSGERSNPEWIICESCSAPSFGNITAQKYIQEIPKLLKEKYNNR